MSWNTLKLK